MTYSIYDALVPTLVRGLKGLSHVMKKGADDAEARKIDPSVYINDRLAPDMLPFSRQIQIACDGAVRGVARTAGVEIPSFPDTETTFDELQERIAKAIAFIESVPQSAFEGAEDRTVVMPLRQGEMTFVGASFVSSFVIPNVLFHVTAAYLILRHNGVQIGKMDYLGGQN